MPSSKTPKMPDHNPSHNGLKWGAVFINSREDWFLYDYSISDDGLTVIDKMEALIGASWSRLHAAGHRMVRLSLVSGIPCNYVFAWPANLGYRVSGIMEPEEMLSKQ